MILVTLGTQDRSFIRLLKEIDEQIKKKHIKDRVVAQIGYTEFKSKRMEIHDYFTMEEFNKYMKEADVVITHGGVGSVLGALDKNKKVIAFPRLAKYKEHVNDHQIQMVNTLAKNGYILTGRVSELGKLLKSVQDFKPKKYKSNNEKFNDLIIDYIENNKK